MRDIDTGRVWQGLLRDGIPRMSTRREDGIYFLLLGCAIFLLVGMALENAAPVTTVDFRVVYYSARCLLDHHDPYNEGELARTYRSEGGTTSQDTQSIKQTETQYIYFPSAFPFTVPFALFSFGAAHFLWLAVTAFSLIAGTILIWDVASVYSPLLSGFLLGLLLANCELYLALGNPGGITVGFCAIAVWCFMRNRWAAAGIVCLAISLMLKPHNAGLVWLFFLLAGGVYRKRALQTLLVIAILSLPALLFVSYAAPNWLGELHANLVGNSVHGSLSDPGPESSAGHGIGMMINLQTVISIFRDDPRIYNPVTYIVVGGLIITWLLKVARSRASSETVWFALAPISALSMLPVYHRLYDAKILVLAVPACAMLWARGGTRAKTALGLTLAAILLTGGVPWAIFFRILSHISVPDSAYTPIVLIVLQVFPVPLILLAFGIFYLLVYMRLGNAVGEARWRSDS